MRALAIAVMLVAVAGMPALAQSGGDSAPSAVRKAVLEGFSYSTIDKIAIAGAIAVARGHFRIEGQPFKSEILLERFPFGWQMIDLGRPAIAPCQLAARNVDSAALKHFADAVGLAPDTTDACRYPPEDLGAPGDTVAVRALMAPVKLFVPRVRAVGDYAIAEWYGGGGGQDLFAKRNGTWRRIGGGGGAFDSELLVKKYHVPAGIAIQLLAPQ